jgi:hypothetical protein
LGLWPGKLTERRKKAQFRAGYHDTINLLEFELRKLGASNVVLQVALEPRDIRMDGLPRADARPMKHPGVILAFQSRFGPLSYPCDTFETWEDNLRAIALALECLRAVDRYGVTKRGEQYKGWDALGYKPPDNGTMTTEEAERLLAGYGGEKQAILKTHPDRAGEPEHFKRLQMARKLLGLC